MFSKVLLGSLLAGSALAAPIPTDTEIQVRLKTKVGSKISKVKDPVEAVVITPILMGGRVVIPAGTTVLGQVIAAGPSSKPEERPILHIEFSELRDSAGAKTPAALKLAAIDNAREKVDEQGRITGILASETYSGKLDQELEKLGQRYSRLADFLGAAKGTVFKQADPEITCEPGVELTLKLAKPLAWESKAPGAEVNPITPQDELAAMVNAQPFQTTAQKPPKPSDVTNLMYIGSKEKIQAIFAAAGWHTAAALSAISKLETVSALAEDRGYKEAPMSTLLLQGQEPAMVFQKQHNTFAKRHHLRIWSRPVKFQGMDVWVCAATHDIGIEFSPLNKTFIHKIDSQIDRERAKVVSDLLFTGLVKGLALVDRPAVPQQGENATGDKLETDGKIAVLLL